MPTRDDNHPHERAGVLRQILNEVQAIRESATAPVSLTLSAPKAAALVGVGERVWWEWNASERIPSPVDLPGRRTVWLRADVEAWLRLGCPSRTDFARQKRLERRA